MGLNYYTNIVTKCPHCDGKIDSGEKIHIGKSSCNRSFLFEVGNKVLDRMIVNNTEDYFKFLEDFCGKIVDEYDREITLDELITLVDAKSDESQELNCPGDFFDGIARFTDCSFR
jgi:hypothetical protein